MYETLSILVHADSKVGKTTLASSCPAPILILDAEGGSKFLPVRRTSWDPLLGGPPAYDGTWDVCIVVVRDFDTVLRVFDWLNYGGHSFRSIVVDSISEIQRRCKQALVGTSAMQQQAWGELLTKMDTVIRGFRDLTFHPTTPVQVTMFIAETREVNGKWKPYMQGQIAVALPYWMDVVGYLFVQEVANPEDPQNPSRKIRRLLVSPSPQFEAGERVQGRLGEIVDEPNITTMLITVYPHLGAGGTTP
jgi:hypothetical protein